MDFTADREEATIATLITSLTTLVMNTLQQKNAAIMALKQKIEELQAEPTELNDK